MKVLVVGCGGQVGSALMRQTWPEGFRVEGVGHADLDITDHAAVLDHVGRRRADLVINAAAYTAVDRAEKEVAAAFAANGEGPRYLAEACTVADAALIHYSTDQVFDGEAPMQYAETAPINPNNVYGASKAAGEANIRAQLNRHLILRTAWVYGVNGLNFVNRLLALAESVPEIRVVNDQFGAPTWADEIARATVMLARLIATEDVAWGTYHFTGHGSTSRFGFAEAIFALAARYGVCQPRLVPIRTAEHPAAARRPANSVLDCTRFAREFGIIAPPWKDSLDRMLADLFGTGASASGAHHV